MGVGHTTNHYHQARILQCVQLLLGSHCPFQMFGNHSLHWWICSHWASLGTAWPYEADRLGGRPSTPASTGCYWEGLVYQQPALFPLRSYHGLLRLVMRWQLVWSPCRGRRDLYGSSKGCSQTWCLFTSSGQLPCASQVIIKDSQPHTGHTVGVAPHHV